MQTNPYFGRQPFPSHPHSRVRFCGVFLALAWLALSTAQAQTTTYALGTSALLEGPTAGSDSVVLAVTPATGTWTATANAAWLHLSPANQSGTGSTNVIFSYDANPDATRTGTLTIASQTLTVTQAGSTYVATDPMTTLVSSGLHGPFGVAVDGAGNVYIADTYNDAIKEWAVANNTVTSLVSSGLIQPRGVAVDGAGNVYIADAGNSAVKEWTAANNTVTTLVSSGLNFPCAVALDGETNVYIADSANVAIYKWTRANDTLTTLISSGLGQPRGVAVDAAGNVYVADVDSFSIKMWTVANHTLTTLVSLFGGPNGVAVDGAGNVYSYSADYAGTAVQKWTAANNSLTTLVSSGLDQPYGAVAVDGTGNVYIPDNYYSAIYELPYAFVDTTPRSESLATGSDSLPAVLPATENLLPPFAPTSDQSWLTINGINNGVVSFSFTAAASNRTGTISLLGQTVFVNQGGPIYTLGTTTRLEGPTAGSDSVVLAVTPTPGTWTASPNATWLHLSPANQSGTGSTNVIFSYDANTGATRTGTLTIAGLTLTVTQAGTTYVVVTSATTLVSSGLLYPYGVAADGSGNVYIADSHNSATTPDIKEWNVTNNTVTTLVSSGLNFPCGVAVDGAGNVYIADTGHSALKEWIAASNSVTTLVSSGLNSPCAVALDGETNVYIADDANIAIYKWTRATHYLTTLASSGLGQPTGVAVDAAGNVYIGDYGNGAIEMWSAANGDLSTLVSSGLIAPYGVAVDGSGNVYVANYDYSTPGIQKWSAANRTLTKPVSSGLYRPGGVAVDGAGNVYIANTFGYTIQELPFAFVDPTPKLESSAAGSDSLPVVVPATANLQAPFTPTSDESWLTISGITNGVVSFSFAATTTNRTGHITLLGQAIPVMQGPLSYIGTNALAEGPVAGSDSVLLLVSPPDSAWTNSANAPWLHLSLANESGAGDTNVVFTFDDNPGGMRSGTLTIAGLTLTVTQGGATFVLSTNAFSEGSAAGSDSVSLTATPPKETGRTRRMLPGCISARPIKPVQAAQMWFSVLTPIQAGRALAP
ncbi:MAG: BACON domain-containing protein [Limisphaerales bacterium]